MLVRVIKTYYCMQGPDNAFPNNGCYVVNQFKNPNQTKIATPYSCVLIHVICLAKYCLPEIFLVTCFLDTFSTSIVYLL